MATQKHLLITGTSNVSWKDAIVQAVSEASKTIDYLTNVKILEQRATISGKKLTEYFVDLDLVFNVDRERED
ncbi:MAG: dodecin domain-containing protein [Clostridia bacterium]|nr:dodecin domain-containing protein [Clostridia bacterium]